MLYWHLSSLVVFNIKKLQIKKHNQILRTCFKTASTVDSLEPKGWAFKKRPYTILSEQCSDNKTVHNKILTMKLKLNKTNFYYFYYWNFVTILAQRYRPKYQRYEIPIGPVDSKNAVWFRSSANHGLYPKLLDIQSLWTTTCLDSKNLNQSVTKVSKGSSCMVSKKPYRRTHYLQPMIKKLKKITSNQTRIKFQTVFLIRPLLTVSRSETKILSNFWNLPIFPDRTNLQLKYRRNRIRYQLLPALKILFNPKMDSVLLEFSEITNKENRYFDFFSKKIIKNY